MESILKLFSDEMIYALGWTVVHSLWQASLIALIMSYFINRHIAGKSIFRYRIASASLFAVLIAALSTFIIYYDQASHAIVLESSQITFGGVVSSESMNSSILASLSSFFENNISLIVAVWFLGVLLFLIKMIGGLVYLRTLVQKSSPLNNPEITLLFQRLKNRLRFQKTIELMESAMIQTPMMMGHIKPFILFPVGMINKLEIEEVEAILAHELSHIYRNDYLINIVQSFVEIFFYYHPAIWWISANIKSERENCCDELAVKLSGNRMKYASALIKLKELEISYVPSLAIPFSNSNENLFHRIKRIFNQPQNKSNLKEKLVMIAFLFSSIVLFAFGKTHLSIDAITDNCIEDEKVLVQTIDQNKIHMVSLRPSNSSLDTVPKKKKNTIVIEKDDGQKSVKLKMENGEIEHLEIDGKVIPKEEYDKHTQTIEEIKPLSRKNGFVYSFGPDLGKEMYILADSIFHDPDHKIYKFFGDGNAFNFRDKMILSDSIKWDFKLNDQMEKAMEAYEEAMKNHEGFFFNLDDFDGDYSFFLDKAKDLRFNLDSMNNNFWFEHNDSLPKKFRFDFDGPTIWDGENNRIFEFLTDSSFNGQYIFPDIKSFDFVKPYVFPDRHDGEDHGPSILWGGRSIQSRIMSELQRDGLVTDSAKEYEIELSGKNMKINGKKMPKEIWQKYKNLYERNQGIELNKKSKIVFKSRISDQRGLRFRTI